MHACPNLFLIGSEKGGSTTLAFQLVTHPEIAFFSNKEPNYFNQPTVSACRDIIAKHLPCEKPQRYTLDATVNYSKHPQYDRVPQSIAEICGVDAPRFLYLMRNPVDRAISHYYWRRERYGEALEIKDAITPTSQYVLSSRYDLQIERYHAVFPAKNLRCLVFDTYYANVADEFSALCRWLDIADDVTPDLNLARGATNKKITRAARFPVINRLAQASPGLRKAVRSFLPHRQQIKLTQALSKEIPREPISPDLRAQFQSYFTESIARTQELTGQDLSCWSTA